MNTDSIQAKARSLGFHLTGIAPIAASPEAHFYQEWLDKGYAGEMQYLEKQKQARLDPRQLMPDIRSVIVCAVNYNSDRPRTTIDRARAWISRYAWGEDYHETLQAKLRELAGWVQAEFGGDTRAYVDTGPLIERVYAKYAGLGWFGKNTCMINQKIGSWFFLGCILTNLDLQFGVPAPDRCGSCTRCIDACPTDALLEPYVLDSRRCIAYLNIELRGAIPEDMREGIGHHLFGCDICQDVCPWNRKAPATDVPAFEPKAGLFWPEIDKLLNLTEDEWRTMIRGTSIKRAKVKGLLRNLMVVAGNSGLKRFLPQVERYLTHEDESIRSHAEWAVSRLKQI